MSSPAYKSAKEQFATWGVDTDAALTTLASTPVSLHCWQGDDVDGFENASGNAGSGCVATGNYPGKARNFAELTADLEQVAQLVPVVPAGRNRNPVVFILPPFARIPRSPEATVRRARYTGNALVFARTLPGPVCGTR